MFRVAAQFVFEHGDFQSDCYIDTLFANLLNHPLVHLKTVRSLWYIKIVFQFIHIIFFAFRFSHHLNSVVAAAADVPADDE